MTMDFVRQRGICFLTHLEMRMDSVKLRVRLTGLEMVRGLYLSSGLN